MMVLHRFISGMLALLALLALLPQATSAGPLADPTRPPAALAPPGSYTPAPTGGPHRTNLDTARAIAAAARSANPPSVPAPAAIQLQSVQVRADGTALAMVDGHLVRVGDQIDGRRVLAIDHQGLLIKNASGTERVWLLAGSPKQAVGSITASRLAGYQPEPAKTDGLASLNPNTTATPAPLSLAGKSTP